MFAFYAKREPKFFDIVSQFSDHSQGELEGLPFLVSTTHKV